MYFWHLRAQLKFNWHLFAAICDRAIKKTETVLHMGNLSLLKSLPPNKCRRPLLRPGNVCILYLNYSPSYSAKYAKTLTEVFLYVGLSSPPSLGKP